MTGAKALAILASYAVLTLWVPERWAWSIAQIAAFAGIGVWATRQWRRASPVVTSVWLVLLAAAPLWGLAQLVFHRTIYRWATWEAILTWTTWLALCFLAMQVLEDARARQWFLQFAAYFGGGLSILATVGLLTARGKIFWLFPSGFNDFVLGPFVNRNQYAAFLEMSLPIALWQALRDRHSLANYAMAAAMFASVVAAASRAGVVLMGAEAVAVILLMGSRPIKTGALVRGLAVFLGLIAVFTAIAGWQVLGQRLRDPDPWAVRREILASSVSMLRERPIMGYGLGNWARAYPRFALYDDGTYVNQAHNDWLQWASEGGLPFVIALLILAAGVIPAACRSIWAIGLISVWVHCLVEYPLQQRPGIGLWFFVLMGVLAAQQRGNHTVAEALDKGSERVHIEVGARIECGPQSVSPFKKGK